MRTRIILTILAIILSTSSIPDARAWVQMINHVYFSFRCDCPDGSTFESGSYQTAAARDAAAIRHCKDLQVSYRGDGDGIDIIRPIETRTDDAGTDRNHWVGDDDDSGARYIDRSGRAAMEALRSLGREYPDLRATLSLFIMYPENIPMVFAVDPDSTGTTLVTADSDLQLEDILRASGLFIEDMRVIYPWKRAAASPADEPENSWGAVKSRYR